MFGSAASTFPWACIRHLAVDTASVRDTTTGPHSTSNTGGTNATCTAIGEATTTTITTHVRSWGLTSCITAHRRPTMGFVSGVAATAIDTTDIVTPIVTGVIRTDGVSTTIAGGVAATDVVNGAAAGK